MRTIFRTMKKAFKVLHFIQMSSVYEYIFGVLQRPGLQSLSELYYINSALYVVEMIYSMRMGLPAQKNALLLVTQMMVV